MFVRNFGAFVVALVAACIASAAAQTPSLPKAVRADAAGFSEDVLAFLRPSIADDVASFDSDHVLRLASPTNGQNVYVNFAPAFQDCVKAPADCTAKVDDFLDSISADLVNARSARDKRDRDDDSLFAVVHRSDVLAPLVPRGKYEARALAAAPRASSSEAVPLEPDAFARYVRNRAQLYSPLSVRLIIDEGKMTVGQPLSLVADSKKGNFGDTAQYDLTFYHAKCVVRPANCEGIVSDFVQDFAQMHDMFTTTFDRTKLRAFLSLRAAQLQTYLVKVNGTWTSAMDVYEPVFGNFLVVCQPYDSPQRIMRPHLKALGLSAGDALALCESNLRNDIGSMPEAYGTQLPPDGIAMVQGAKYESGRLLFVDQWAPLAAALGGLLVAAPAHDMIVYARDTPASVRALNERARAIKAQAGAIDGLSSSVFRWTKDGWKTAIDDD